MTDATQIDRERRLYNLGCYLRSTPIHLIDFEQTRQALQQIEQEQREEQDTS